MRVKYVVAGSFDGEDETEVVFVVPEHVSAKDVMLEQEFECLCECYAVEDAQRIVDLWNKAYADA